MNLDEAWDKYCREKLIQCVDQKRQIMCWRNIVSYFDERYFHSADITSDDLEHLVKYRKEEHGVSKQTVKRDLAVLKAVMKNADMKIPKFPIIRYQAKNRALNSAAVDNIVAQATADIRLLTFVMIALNTGARPGAITGLTWDRVDLSNRIIDFNDPGLSKAERRKPRAVVPISDRLREFLEKLPCQVGHVCRTDGYPINHLWKKHIIGGFTPHQLRHTVATRIAQRFDLLTAARLLGHKSVKTTEQVYVHLTAEHLRGPVESL